MKTEESKMITAKEYTEMHNSHYTTVMNWLRRDLTPGAIKEELPFGEYFYKIPAGAPIPELKPGHILPKTDGPRRASKKSAKKGVRAK